MRSVSQAVSSVQPAQCRAFPSRQQSDRPTSCAPQDENEAVRTATVTTLLRLSHGNPELAAAALDYLIDMLNDELEAVRVHAAAGLAGMEGECATALNATHRQCSAEEPPAAVRRRFTLLQTPGRAPFSTDLSAHRSPLAVTEVTVPESQLRLLLCGLEDTSAEMRRSVATFVARLNCRSAAALESTVAALLRSLAEASPAEFQCSAGALARLGQRHAPLVECLVDTLFGEQVSTTQGTADLEVAQWICSMRKCVMSKLIDTCS